MSATAQHAMEIFIEEKHGEGNLLFGEIEKCSCKLKQNIAHRESHFAEFSMCEVNKFFVRKN